MVSESMGEDQSESSLLNMGTMTLLDDQFVAFEDYALKARKPYTITKQREKWTQEEHKKFLEALRLYGRAWRRIEEHVGNKTAVQIRSHAQKFFSKVVDGTEVEPIEIPPPRAKRKPTRPYPRKELVQSKKRACVTRSTSCSLGSTLENPSPTSVLSMGGADSCLQKAGSLLEENGSSLCAQENDNTSSTKHAEKTSANSHLPVSVSTQSLKLFGKTFVVTDSASSSSPDVLPWNSTHARAPECPPTTPCWSVNYRYVAYPFLHKSEGAEVLTHDGRNRVNSKGDKDGKGFVGYKRCLEEKNTHSLMSTGEEREELRVRLCL